MRQLVYVFAVSLVVASCQDLPSGPDTDTLTSSDTSSEEPLHDTLLVQTSDSGNADTLKITDYGRMVNSIDEISYFLSDIKNIKIEFRFETSVTIHGEGPHCDLIDWKHGYTDWKIMQPDSGNKTLQIPDIPETIQSTFPEIPFSEVKDKIREHCGESWYTLISKKNSMKDSPIEVGASRIIFRIGGTRIDNGVKTIRLFSMYVPMGC